MNMDMIRKIKTVNACCYGSEQFFRVLLLTHVIITPSLTLV